MGNPIEKTTCASPAIAGKIGRTSWFDPFCILNFGFSVLPPAFHFSLVFFSIAAAAPNRADYLILERPFAHNILDQYENRITRQSAPDLLPYSPFRIVAKNETMSDGITPAVHLECGERLYYLPRKPGTAFPDRSKGHARVFSGLQIHTDTLRVLRDRSLLMARRFPGDGKRFYLKQGDLIVRRFSHSGKTCVLRIGERPAYGWVSLSRKDAWARLEHRPDLPKKGHVKEIRGIVSGRLRKANRTYARFFRRFNEETGLPRPLPLWRTSLRGDDILCALTGASNYPDLFSRSTQFLIQDLAGLLIGEPVKVLPHEMGIRIQSTKESGL